MLPRAQAALLGMVWFLLQSEASLGIEDSLASVINYHMGTTEMQLIEEQVNRFKVQLVQNLPFGRNGRHKRDTYASSEVTGMAPMPHLNVNASHVEGSSDISCFVYHDAHYCIFGDSLFAVSDGHFEHLLSGLPVQQGDLIKTYVYNDDIFMAFYNLPEANLRLYMLRSPDSTTLVGIQHILAEKLEDCLFFEHEGFFYLAVALQLGPSQYSDYLGMQCMIYEWIGTTMDMIHFIPVDHLRKIVFFKDEEASFILVLGNGHNVQLWRLSSNVQESELTDKLDVGYEDILQVEVLMVLDCWCVLFSSLYQSSIYCLIGEKLLKWQVMEHTHANIPFSWSHFQLSRKPNDYQSSLLIFNSYDRQNHSNWFDFYYSNSSGLFSHGFFSNDQLDSDCLPADSIALSNTLHSAQLIQTCAMDHKVVLRGYDISFSESTREEPRRDPLLSCLDTINDLIQQFEKFGDVTELEKNLLLAGEDFSTDGTVFVEEFDSDSHEFVTLEVLHEHIDHLNSTSEIGTVTREMMATALEMAQELPQFVYSTNATNLINGNLIVNGNVTAGNVSLASISTVTVNGRVWNQFAPSVLRHSIDQDIDHDINIDNVIAQDVKVKDGAVGGVDPARWFLQSGGTLTGTVFFQDVHVDGDIGVDDNIVNDVDMTDVVTRDQQNSAISGAKEFRGMTVKNRIDTRQLNEAQNISDWFGTLARTKSDGDDAVHFTGRVEILGPVDVGGEVACQTVNDLIPLRLPELLVMNDSPQTITGQIRYINDVEVTEAVIKTLNDVVFDDLLSTSTFQVVGTPLFADTIQSVDIDCPDINGVNFNDAVFIDDAESVIAGPVRFENQVEIRQLTIDEGAMLDELDLDWLLHPQKIVIDSPVEVLNGAFMDNVNVTVINDFDVTDLPSRYWTKSVNQTIPVDTVVLSNATNFLANVAADTFLARSLSDDFFLTNADEMLEVDVVFKGHVDVTGNLSVSDENGVFIHGINLDALDKEAVKNTGKYRLNGIKTLDRLQVGGNLTVDETINGLRVPDDVVLLDRQQTLTNAVFDSDVMTGDVTSSNGHIIVRDLNDVELESFVHQVLLVDEDAELGELEFNDEVVADNIHVDNLKGINIRNISLHGLRKRGVNRQNLTHLTVNGNLQLGSSCHIVFLNNYNVSDVLGNVVDLRDARFITGNKSTTSLKVEGDAHFGTFNDRPLDFSHLLSASREQNITGNFTFGNLSAGSMDVKSINGLDLSEFVRTTGTNETQVISGIIKVDNIAVERLTIESSTLNGCSISRFLGVKNFTHFDSMTIVNGSLILEHTKDSNPLLASLLEGAVRTDQPQSISGRVKIPSSEPTTSMGHVSVNSNRLSGIDLNRLFHQSMLKSVPQDISGSIQYVGSISADALEPVGDLEFNRWDDHHVRDVIDDMVMKSNPQAVTAKKTIHGLWNISGDLNFSGTIDGVSLESAVKVSDRHLPAGTVFSNLEVKKEVNVSGTIDGVDVSDLLERRVPISGDFVIEGLVTLQNVSVGDVFVDQINDLELNDAVLKANAPSQNISGAKIIKDGVGFEGDVVVAKLDDRNAEEIFVDVVEKDQDAEFKQPVIFEGGLQVTKKLAIGQFNETDLSEALQAIINDTNQFEDLANEENSTNSSDNVLDFLQGTPVNRFAEFEYFESIQEFLLDVPLLSSASMEIDFSPLPTRKGDDGSYVTTVVRTTSGDNCGLEESCQCYQATLLSVDSEGRSRILRSSKIRGFVDSNTDIRGAKLRMFSRQDWLFIIKIQNSTTQCSKDTVDVLIVNSLTFESFMNTSIELDSYFTDVALEQHPDGVVFIAISQSTSDVLIYTFDGVSMNHLQTIAVTGAVALDMAISTRGAVDGVAIYLVVAVPGAEANATLWKFTGENDGTFRKVQKLDTIGAVDVLFTVTKDTIYVTFAQDPANSDPHGDSSSQFSVPARTFRYSEVTDTFEIFQKLDMDRVVSLTNLEINELPYIAVATHVGSVRIYRAVPGQGFQTVQTFKLPGVQSIRGFTIRDQTFLTAALKTGIQTFAARIRGLRKPSLSK